jgi:hypothetical protein
VFQLVGGGGSDEEVRLEAAFLLSDSKSALVPPYNPPYNNKTE